MSEEKTEFEFMDQVPVRERKKGLFAQVREMMAEGGVIPVNWACKMMGVSRQRVHELIKNNDLRGVRAADTNIVCLYLREVEAWVENHPRKKNNKIKFPARQRA